MPNRLSSLAETLEERRLLSTASAGVAAVAAPHAASAARHALPTENGDGASAVSPQAEAKDAEDSSQGAVLPSPAPAAAESEDQTDAVASSNGGVTNSSDSAALPSAVEASLVPSPARSQAISEAVLGTSAILEGTANAGDREASRVAGEAPRTDVTAVVFNTRQLVTPNDGEARAAALPLASLVAPHATGAFSGRAPMVLKSSADALLLLGLGHPDILGTFADAITSFAHESAAAAAAAVGTMLTAPETHYYKWEVSGTVLGIDALLIGHWFAIRRRRRHAAAAMPPFSTRAIPEADGRRHARIE